MSYEKVIRIDVKSNFENNNDLYVHIISDIPLKPGSSNEILPDQFLNTWLMQICKIEQPSEKGYTFVLISPDDLIGAIVECLFKNDKGARSIR